MKHSNKIATFTLALTAAFASARAGDITDKDGKSIVTSPDYWSLVNVSFSEGIQSTYLFRGDNMTPGSDGFLTSDLEVTAPGFEKGQSVTLGVWAGFQTGSSDYDGFPQTINGTANHGEALSYIVNRHRYVPETVSTHQSAYHELDLDLKYKIELSPMFVAEAGDIAYLSSYDAKVTKEEPRGYYFLATHNRFLTNHISGSESQNIRDQLFLTLSTNPKWCEHIVPSLTYYQSIYENGSAPYGGYLEGRIDGYAPLLKMNGEDFISIRPYTLISVSFDDRSEPSQYFGRHYFTGWNDFEVGIDVPVALCKYFTITGSAAYSRKLATPDLGTNSDELWAGAKATVTF